MDVIDSKIMNYAISKSNIPSKDCELIELETTTKHPLGHMVCGKLEASLLGFLIHSCNVKRVLELGTFTGYSSLAMAEQLPEDGEVVTIDKNKKINAAAQKFWANSKHKTKIMPIFGAAIDKIPQLNGKFDLVFIDADKANYLNYLKLVLPILTSNGVIVVDNVLFGGTVIKDLELEENKSTRYISELNDFIEESEDLYGTLIPIRDGIFLIKKLNK